MSPAEINYVIRFLAVNGMIGLASWRHETLEFKNGKNKKTLFANTMVLVAT
jgi:hypothetical protein